MILKTCMLTENATYRKQTPIKPQGIVVHSTGCNQQYLARWVQPSADDPNYNEIIADIGKNRNNNDWNDPAQTTIVHAMIGYNTSDKVEIYQTLEWDRKCGGCYKGVNGSYNNTHIQFEMLEDNHTDESYFSEVLAQAIELCAYLCQEYGIPVENIVSHKEAGEAGYASMHGDPENWFKDMGYSMDEFRKEVAAMIEPRAQYNRGDVVALNEGVTTYYDGTPMASFVYDGRPLYVLNSDYLLTGITIDPTLSARTGTVNTADIHLREPDGNITFINNEDTPESVDPEALEHLGSILAAADDALLDAFAQMEAVQEDLAILKTNLQDAIDALEELTGK